MISVSNYFKTAMKQPVKELQAYLNTEGLSIRDEDDLISYKIGGEGGLCKTVMRKLEAKYLGEHNLLGKWVSAGFGVKLPSGAYEFLNHGSFQVNELTFSKDTGETSIVAYDKMINAMKPYVALDVEYPIGLYDYTKKLCEACNLELGNEYFGINALKNITSYVWRDNVGGIAEIQGDCIKVIMPETPMQYSGVYSTQIRESLADYFGKKMVYSFYARSDAERTIVFQSAGEEGYHYINLTTEWQRYYYVVEKVADFSPTFYCGNTLDKTPYYIKDIMLEEAHALGEYRPYNTMNDWPVERELWENIDGITYRDIFAQIAQATASTCIIGADDKVYFKPITGTGEQLTYDNLFKLKLEDQYGEINSVVLSRDPVEGEDVLLKDDASIEANGLTEFKISNNEIVDKNREGAIEPIYNALKGTKYYPFEATTEGLGWYEIGDAFDIISDTGDVFPTVLFNINITVDGSLKETLKTVAETKTQTQYQYATTISKRIKNTEILVNKQDGKIQSLVSDMYDEEGVVNQKYTQITQDIEKIVASVQNSGGGNLLKDSVMFAYANINQQSEEQKRQSPWTVSESGTITAQEDTESISAGGVSGHSFTLANKSATQRVSVKISTAEDKSHYTFSTKIKKDSAGSCGVRIYNTKEEYTIPVVEGESAFYKEYSLTLEPQENYYYVEFYCDDEGNATFTDNMLAVGESKSQWTQANGEVMNTQVNISLEGVRVNRGGGDYTIMSPSEFAGYSENKRVFSLNKDVTEVTKLNAIDEVNMSPIKIVPITTGDLQGWAFVPSTRKEG